jgi:hypothetical protein
LTHEMTVPCAVAAVLELLDGSNGSNGSRDHVGRVGHERFQEAAAARPGGIRLIHEQNGASR